MSHRPDIILVEPFYAIVPAPLYMIKKTNTRMPYRVWDEGNHVYSNFSWYRKCVHLVERDSVLIFQDMSSIYCHLQEVKIISQPPDQTYLAWLSWTEYYFYFMSCISSTTVLYSWLQSSRSNFKRIPIIYVYICIPTPSLDLGNSTWESDPRP